MHHSLDTKVSEIEARIEVIISQSPKFTEGDSTIQASLLAYAWIMLDSWIAWRTLRFLIRNLDISESVKKWFKTPSSYTGSQLYAAWGFSDSSREYLKQVCGMDIKSIIDHDIQKKRNRYAHQTDGVTNDPGDYDNLKKYYEFLKMLFCFYENISLFVDFSRVFERNGYSESCVEYWKDDSHIGESKIISIGDMGDSAMLYFEADEVRFICMGTDKKEKMIRFSKKPRSSEVRDSKEMWQPLSDETDNYFRLLDSNGYCLDYETIALQAQSVWES